MHAVLSASPPTRPPHARVAPLTTMCFAMLVESVRVLVTIARITLLLLVGDALRPLQSRDPGMDVFFSLHQAGSRM